MAKTTYHSREYPNKEPEFEPIVSRPAKKVLKSVGLTFLVGVLPMVLTTNFGSYIYSKAELEKGRKPNEIRKELYPKKAPEIFTEPGLKLACVVHETFNEE